MTSGTLDARKSASPGGASGDMKSFGVTCPRVSRKMTSAVSRDNHAPSLLQSCVTALGESRVRRANSTRERVVVVFDGKGSRVSEERETEGLQVFYADAATTADAVVERLAAKYATAHRIRVVSADGMVRDSIMASGAEWMSPDGLRELCDRAETEMRRRIGG